MRSAVYHGASSPERQRTHDAIAAGLDAERQPDVDGGSVAHSKEDNRSSNRLVELGVHRIRA
jgi:hypothetical protein